MANSTSYADRVVNARPFGWEYTPNPVLTHFKFEEIDPYYWHDVFLAYSTLPIYVGTAYVVAIFGIQRFMRDRPAYKLRMPLFWWNFALGVFSIIGFARTLPGFLNILSFPGGFYISICEKKHNDIPSGFWGWLFIMSKFWELGDTLFIVLRKRPLVFLQWYHHLITMSAVWTLAPYFEPISRWYIVLNYGVHSFMYPYFAARAINIRIPNFIANLITTMQLAQMIIGFSVNSLSLYFQQSGQGCFRYLISIQVFSVVYGTFIILFGKLFYDIVFQKRRTEKKVSKKVE